MDGMNQNNNNMHQQGSSAQPQTDVPYQATGVQPNNQYQTNDPYNHNPYQPQDNFNALPVQTYNPRGNKGAGAKAVIAIACTLVVLIGIGVGALTYYRSQPSYKVNRGLLNLAGEIAQINDPLSEKVGMTDILIMMQEEGSHVATELNFTTEVPVMGGSTVTLGVDTDFYKDVNARELSSETSLNILNYDFAHFNIYANDEVFCLSMPELFMENMYIENENVVSQYNDSFLNNFLQGGTPSEAEDFSINLFPDEDERISLREWRDNTAFLKRFESDINACRDGMTIEKVDTGLYRVIFPARETDRLTKDILESYEKLYGAEEELDMWREYKTLVLSDVSLLFEIDGKNRIESIAFEEPLDVLDGAASLEAELFFMGDKRSIDKIQGKLKANGIDDIDREALWQIQQTSDDDLYSMDMDFRWTEAEETLGKMKFTMRCDASKDEFDITCSVKDDVSEMKFIVETSVDDYVRGESLEIDLDKAVVSLDGEELIKLSGDIDIEPLQGAVIPAAEPETALFEMTYAEWLEILYLLEDEYGGVIDYLWDYMW